MSARKDVKNMIDEAEDQGFRVVRESERALVFGKYANQAPVYVKLMATDSGVFEVRGRLRRLGVILPSAMVKPKSSSMQKSDQIRKEPIMPPTVPLKTNATPSDPFQDAIDKINTAADLLGEAANAISVAQKQSQELQTIKDALRRVVL